MYHDFEDLVEDDKKRCLSWDLPRLQAFVEREKAWFQKKWERENELSKICVIQSLGRTRLHESDYLEFLEFLVCEKRVQMQKRKKVKEDTQR